MKRTIVNSLRLKLQKFPQKYYCSSSHTFPKFEALLSKGIQEKLKFMTGLVLPQNRSEYLKFCKTFSISAKNDPEIFTSLLFMQSLLFSKTKDNNFLTALRFNRQTIEAMFTESTGDVNKILGSNAEKIEESELIKLDRYLVLVLAKSLLNSGSKSPFIEDYDLLKAFNDLHSENFTENETPTSEKLKKEILLKTLLFYPIVHRMPRDRRNKSIFNTIFDALALYDIFKFHLIKQLKTSEREGQITFYSSPLLQVVFILTQESLRFKDFLQLLCDITPFLEIKSKFANEILKYFSLWMASKKVDPSSPDTSFENILSVNLELLLAACKVIQTDIKSVPPNSLLNIMVFITKANLIKFNNFFYSEFWLDAIVVMEKNIELMSMQQKNNFFYAIGKFGFITPLIASQMVSFAKNSIKTDLHSDLLNNRKFLKAGINLKLFSEEDIAPIINFALERTKKSNEAGQFELFMKDIAPHLLRMGYKDMDFWTPYFEWVEENLCREKKPEYFIFFVLKTFPLMFEKQEKSSNIMSLFKKLLENKKVQKFIESPLAIFLREISKKKLIIGSLLETKTRTALKRLGLNFIEQAHVNAFVIDFLIPEKNLIVETHGPQHFIKRIDKQNSKEMSKELNLITEFKYRCLQKLGYKTLVLDGQSVVDKTKSFELDFFEKYEKIH